MRQASRVQYDLHAMMRIANSGALVVTGIRISQQDYAVLWSDVRVDDGIDCPPPFIILHLAGRAVRITESDPDE